MSIYRKNSNLMLLYEQQKSFQRHRHNLEKLSRKKNSQFPFQKYKSQMQVIHVCKKNNQAAYLRKQNKKLKQIEEENQKLRLSLLKEYNRPKKAIFMNETLRQTNSRSSIRSSRSQSKKREVERQNSRLMEKILVLESGLSKKNLQKDYLKNENLRKRMQTSSSESKSKLKSGLKKLQVKPSLYFPQVKEKMKHSQTSRSSKNTIFN